MAIDECLRAILFILRWRVGGWREKNLAATQGRSAYAIAQRLKAKSVFRRLFIKMGKRAATPCRRGIIQALSTIEFAGV